MMIEEKRDLRKVLVPKEGFPGAKVSWDLDSLLNMIGESKRIESQYEASKEVYLEVLRQIDVFLSFLYQQEKELMEKHIKDFNNQSDEAKIIVVKDRVKIEIL